MIIINDNIVIDKVSHVIAKHSRKEMIQTAEVQLATKYVHKGQLKELSSLLKKGDSIEIYAGYDSIVNLEFAGYISAVKKSIPLVLECEDEMYQLKRQDVKPASWKTTTLVDVIQYIAGGSKISGDVPAIELTPFYITGKQNKLEVLEALKSNYGIDIYYRNRELYAGFAYLDQSVALKKVVYKIGYNTIEQDTQLQYVDSEDVRIKIKAVSVLADNTIYETQAGDADGQLRTIHLYNISKDNIKKRAEEELKLWKFSGYRGKIGTLGLPYAEHGMIAIVRDEDVPERDSEYYIESTQFTGGVEKGLRRSIQLERRAL